jgi:hypothetical protein
MRALIASVLLLVSTLAYAGYDAHITRKAEWSSQSGPRITFAEWQAYVLTDAQVKRDPLNTENDFLVQLPGESFPLWFEPGLGELRTKDPSDHALLKLIQIAKQLHARVQGDDGEFYPPNLP